MSLPESTPIRLLLVDDHEMVRIGLRTLFSKTKTIQTVGEAGTAADALTEAVRVKPDIVLMDLRLPDGSGVEVCREVRAACPATKVLFLTSYSEDDAVFATIMAGASGYLLKEIGGEALVRAIESVVAGKSILDQAVTQRVLARMQSLATQADKVKKREEEEQLSRQEQRVLALVAEGKTNKEIAVALELSDKTVKNYLSNIFQKLHVSRRTQAAAIFIANSDNPT